MVPVSDVDRAKAFYVDRLGFTLDHDAVMSDELRVVQLTPPGSGCSVVIGNGVAGGMPPGSVRGLQLVVADLRRARAELVDRGVAVSEIQVMGQNPRSVADALDNVGFIHFADPDGNGWSVQQISSRP